MKGDLATHLRRVGTLMLVIGIVAGCGRKGSLEPSPSATAKTGTTETQSNSGISAVRAKKPPPVLPPKTPSILDPILE